MAESLIVQLLIGTALGFLTGLGVGGGSLLMLWLTLATQLPMATARAINLMFFLPSALIACLFRRSQGCLPIKKLFPAILCGCCSAFVFSRLSTILNIQFLKKCLSCLMILTGIRELFYKIKQTP